LYHFIPGANLVHNKKIYGNIIHSSSVMKKFLIQQRKC
jgi:hypothetical protein